MKVSRQFLILSLSYGACIVAFLAFSRFLGLNTDSIVHRSKNIVDLSTQSARSTENTVIRNTALVKTSHLKGSYNTSIGLEHGDADKIRTVGDSGETNSTCEPCNRIVFLKTHKTASTTANTIIQRYGYEHNLRFAIPTWRGKFSLVSPFNRKMVASPPGKRKTNATAAVYNVIANHARFNKPEMDAVIPNARYLTILRDPVTRFESVFGYYMVAEHLELNKFPNPIEKFFENPDHYFKKKPFMYFQLKNGMLFSLGLNHIYHNSETKVDRKIRELDKEFDLVLLTEYFDESLLLMKKLLCWDEDDIFYLPKGIRPEKRRYAVDRNLRDKILNWTKADVKLYDHFNRTLWQKVKDYGPSFDADLEHFRNRQRALYNECVDPHGIGKLGDPRERFLALYRNASDFCELLMKRVDGFVNIAREKQWT